MNDIRKGLKPDRFEPIIKKLGENNDTVRLRLLVEHFICDYEDIIYKNLSKSDYSYSKIIDTLNELRAQTQELLDEDWSENDKSMNNAIIKKIETKESMKNRLLKLGGIKARVF
jgi:hypothetical protein